MHMRAWLASLAAIGLTVTAACGSNPRPQAPAIPQAAPKPAAPIPTPQPPADPIASLIHASETHFEAGEREMKVGHLEGARTEFDRAVDVLLESPYGARTDARLREHFDRLVDRINAYEVLALACHSLGDWQKGVEYELSRHALAVPGFDVDEAFDAHL